MGKQLIIYLDGLDLGQLLDGLRLRAEAWQKTAEYLVSGCVSDDSFICEECSDATEASAIAWHYTKIIAQIERQVEKQSGWLVVKRKINRPVKSGYSIFMPTLFQGTMPACYEDDYPVVFPSELEAQREIADNQLTRIQQFLDGERDFDDAIETYEFVLPVKVWRGRQIMTEDGRTYGRQT